jgi:hypothetical protein
MISAIHRFTSEYISINRLRICLSQASYKTALKVAASVAAIFLLYGLKSFFFSSPKSVLPSQSLLPNPTIVPEEDGAEFFTPLDEIGELAVSEDEQKKLAQKLQEVVIQQSPPSALDQLKQIFLPYSYPCELPRRSGTQTVDFIDHFLQMGQVKNCTLDEAGRFTLTYESKQKFTIFHLPDFAVEDFWPMGGSIQSAVKRNRPKVQIANPLSGRIIQQGTFLEIIFDQEAFIIPETGSGQWKFKAEVKSIEFTHGHKKGEPPTVLFCKADHNWSVIKPFTYKGIELWPHYIAQIFDMNSFPAEYGLS